MTASTETQQARGNNLPPAPPGLRENALERFSALGYPTPRQEDWRYTNLREIADGGFSAAAAAAKAPPAEVDRLRGQIGDEAALLFVDGALAADLCGEAPARPLAAALGEDAGAVERVLAAAAEIERSSLVALNTAHLATGALIQVPDDTVVERPIHLLYASSAGLGDARAFHIRNLISVGRNSRVTVVESYLGLGDGVHWTNSATDIALGEGAALEHYKVQRETERSYHTADIAAAQSRDSLWHSVSISLGAKLCRNDIRSRLAAPGAHCSFDGLYMADGVQHVDHHTTIDHAAPHCTSHELYKGILGGRSTGVFNGKVLVRTDAQRTDAQQLNKNLLLSDDASINTKPQLEIFADDVKCSHGATTGRLDEDAIFFLRSRGIGEAAARSLLTYAFANEIVERIGAAPIRDRLETAVRERLDALVAAGRSS
jgi:Fe-S cluster assembly protein SufD